MTSVTTRVLVTGGAGFIGSNLVRALLGAGLTVRVLDNLSTGRRENVASLLSDLDLIEGDVLTGPTLLKAMRGVSVVFHEAALPSVPRSLQDPQRSHEVNASGTLALLIAAREAGVHRVVYASSSSVYGVGAHLPVTESSATSPSSPYAVSKLAGENYCRAFWTSFHVPTICLRYFNVFGPHQDPSSNYAAVIPRFTRAALARVAPVIYGDGSQSRDFTFVGDVVRANILAMTAAPAAFGGVFNVATGNRTSLLKLLRLIRGVAGDPSQAIDWQPARAGDVPHSHADTSLAARVLGYRSTTPLREGLRQTVAWVRETT